MFNTSLLGIVLVRIVIVYDPWYWSNQNHLALFSLSLRELGVGLRQGKRRKSTSLSRLVIPLLHSDMGSETCKTEACDSLHHCKSSMDGGVRKIWLPRNSPRRH